MSQTQFNALMISVLFWIAGFTLAKGCRHDTQIRELQTKTSTAEKASTGP